MHQMADINVTGFIDDSNETIAVNRSDVHYTDSAIRTLFHVTWYVALVLGVPGNVLSAIVWLRRRVAGNNSSAVYLAALAINDLAYLLFLLVYFSFSCGVSWLCHFCDYVVCSTFYNEPLLVLGFSAERLIAILRPLQVRCRPMC